VAYYFTQQAEGDLLQAVAYIAEDNPQVANKLISQVEVTCELITEMPMIGKQVDYIVKPKGIRRFNVKQFHSYILFYRIVELDIEIVRFAHSARDLPKLFQTS